MPSVHGDPNAFPSAAAATFVRVSLTGEDIAPIISGAGATLRAHSTPETLALALGFYEAFLTNHPLTVAINFGPAIG